MCAKDLPPPLFGGWGWGGAFRGCEVQPRLFVSAVFLSVPCGRGCNLLPPPGWELHAPQFAMSPVSWLCPQRQSGARPGVCMSEWEQAGQQFTAGAYQLFHHLFLLFPQPHDCLV